MPNANTTSDRRLPRSTAAALSGNSVRVTTLPGGLRIATDSMPGIESVAIGAWVAAGTRHETPAENGISHMLEHMAFKGTERRTAAGIAEEIENVGGHINAYTARESTAYYARVLKSDMPLAVDILADILQHSRFSEDEMERERGVIIQEIGQSEDTPDDIIFDHFQATAFPDQGLGRPVLGSREIVSGLSRESLKSYLANHYGRSQMVISAAGAVDHDKLVALVDAHFSALPDDCVTKTDAANYQGGEYRGEQDLEQTHIVLGFDGIGHRDPDYWAMTVLSTLLGGGMSSRLFQEVREKHGLVYSIYSFGSGYADGGLFGIYAGTGEAEVPRLLPLIAGELKKVCDHVDEAEVKRAVAQHRAAVLMSLESTSGRCEALAQQLLVYDRPVPPRELVELIEAITPERVVAVARRLFSGKPTLAAMGPLSALDPYERLLGWLA